MGKAANSNSVGLRSGYGARDPIAPGTKQQAVTYLQQLMNESNNQEVLTPIKQNQEGWLLKPQIKD